MKTNNSLVLSFDVEGSGATLPKGYTFEDVMKFWENPTGRIISIGASVVTMDGNHDLEIKDKLFLKLFKPVSAEKSPTGEEGVYVRMDNKHAVRFFSYEGIPHEYEIPMENIPEEEEATIFSSKTWVEFWSTKPEMLKSFRTESKKGILEIEKEAIEQFNEFRKKWEQYAKDNEVELLMCSDNTVYDGYAITYLMNIHLPHLRPLQYAANKNDEYHGSLRDLGEIQKGILGSVDKEWFKSRDYSKFEDFREWMKARCHETNELIKRVDGIPLKEDDFVQMYSKSRRIEYLYNVPAIQFGHTHNPVDDSITIGWGLLVCHGIFDNIFVLRGKNKRFEYDVFGPKKINVSLSIDFGSPKKMKIEK